MATAKMTRKHFQFIAETLKWSRPDADAPPIAHAQWNLIVDEFSRDLCRSNPQFDPTKFREACNK